MLKGDTPAQDRINKKQFESLCALQCTKEEIAAMFDVDADTLNTWCKANYEGKTFSAVFEIKKQAGNISLRRNLMKQSETNPATAIFLAKNRLGLRDNPDDLKNKDDGNKYIYIYQQVI